MPFNPYLNLQYNVILLVIDIPEKFDYEKLMKRARAQIPEAAFTKERFEIPKITSQMSGNRTFIRDFLQIASTIRRDPDHLMHYMAKELGSSASMEGSTAVFIGKFGQFQVEEKFKRYVDEYVLCHECKKPDTKLFKENRLWFLKCEACGAKKSVADVR